MTDTPEADGPYTCIRCCASTWNDCDICDDCLEEGRRDAETTRPSLTQDPGHE